MLKVMKYDWRNGWDAVKYTLLAAVFVSVLAGIGMGFAGGTVVINGNAIGEFGGAFGVVGEGTMDKFVMVLSIVWFAVMTALLVMTVDTIFRNLSGRMFGAEGYLTHTLPVHTWELLLGKAVGTWLFGVFMLFVAFASVLLVLMSTLVGTGELGAILVKAAEFLPKLGDFHFRWMLRGAGYVLYALAAFFAWSFLVVAQLQFICIAGRQFGKFHVAGSIIVFMLLMSLENNLNRLVPYGFLVFLLSTAACAYGSWWLEKKRLAL